MSNRHGRFTRYKEIAKILMKYGFTFLVERLKNKGYLPGVLLRVRRKHTQEPPEIRVRKALEELGPTYIKLGQILSTRKDLFSEEIIRELEKLQDEVTVFPLVEGKAVFEKSFDESFDHAFEFFNHEPVACGSIGQVYEARMKDGQDVVVKIQRPGIRQKILHDLDILYTLAKLGDEHLYKNKAYSFYDIVEEFHYRINNELNYQLEARNAERFYRQFIDDPNIVVPNIHWKYTNQSVLTMERIHGTKLKEFKELDNLDYSTLEKLALNKSKCFLQQIFIHGFFHGDPHPGNIMITDKLKIAYIDFGIMGYLDKESIDFISNLFLAIGRKDYERIVLVLQQNGSLSTETDPRRLKEEASFFISQYYDQPIKDLRLSEILDHFMTIAYKHHIKFPSQFILLLKAIISLEASVSKLSANFSVAHVAREFLKEYYRNRYHPKALTKEYLGYTEDLLYSVKHMPKQLNNLFRKVESEKLVLPVRSEHGKESVEAIIIAGKRISLSLIAGFSVMNGTLLIFQNEMRTLLSLPIASWMFYLIGGTIILRLILKE